MKFIRIGHYVFKIKKISMIEVLEEAIVVYLKKGYKTILFDSNKSFEIAKKEINNLL